MFRLNGERVARRSLSDAPPSWDASSFGLRLYYIPCWEYYASKSWETEYTDEFGQWWQTLLVSRQDAVAARVELLMEYGPKLLYPYSSDIRG